EYFFSVLLALPSVPVLLELVEARAVDGPQALVDVVLAGAGRRPSLPDLGQQVDRGGLALLGGQEGDGRGALVVGPDDGVAAGCGRGWRPGRRPGARSTASRPPGRRRRWRRPRSSTGRRWPGGSPAAGRGCGAGRRRSGAVLGGLTWLPRRHPGRTWPRGGRRPARTAWPGSRPVSGRRGRGRRLSG